MHKGGWELVLNTDLGESISVTEVVQGGVRDLSRRWTG